MGEKGTAFAKGGCGCLVVFAVLALITLLFGGRVRIDFFGVIFLFIVGGVVGLVALAIYNKGKRDRGGD